MQHDGKRHEKRWHHAVWTVAVFAHHDVHAASPIRDHRFEKCKGIGRSRPYPNDELLAESAYRLLHPTLTNDPARRPATLRDWGRRLAGAVREGVIDEHRARAAWARERKVGHDRVK